jgi:hypothetical protein
VVVHSAKADELNVALQNGARVDTRVSDMLGR